MVTSIQFPAAGTVAAVVVAVVVVVSARARRPHYRKLLPSNSHTVTSRSVSICFASCCCISSSDIDDCAAFHPGTREACCICCCFVCASACCCWRRESASFCCSWRCWAAMTASCFCRAASCCLYTQPLWDNKKILRATNYRKTDRPSSLKPDCMQAETRIESWMVCYIYTTQGSISVISPTFVTLIAAVEVLLPVVS